MDLSSLLKRISSIGLLCLLMLGQIKTIAQVTDFTVLSTNVTCPGNGTISVQATGINAQTRFALINPSTQLRPQQELPEFLAVPAGTYTVAVYQGANLVGVKVATVLLEYASPSITNVVEATAYEIPCVAAGTLTVHDNKGMLNVKEPFEYSIDGVNFQSSNVFKGLVKGSYQVTLRDACGATVVRAAQVTEDLLTPTPIVLSRNVNNFAFALGAGACTYDFNPAIVDVNSKSPTLEYRMRLGNNAWSAWTAYANKTSIAANAANRDMITSTSNLIGVEVRDNCKPENVATINVGMAVRPLNDRQPGEGFCETGTKKNVELVFISAVDNSTSTPAASLVGGTVKYRIFEIDGTNNEVIGGDAIPETNWPIGAHLVKHELVPNKRYKALVYNECGIVIEKIIVVAPIAKKQLQRRTQPDGCDKNAGRLAVLDLPNGEPNAYPMTVKAIEQVTGRLLGSVTINSEPANTMATVVVASGIAAGVRYDMEVTFNCPGADYVARNLTMPNFVYDVQTVFEPIELVSGNFDLQLTPTYTGFSNTSIGGSTVRHKIIDGPAGYPTNVLVGMRNLKWSNLAPGTYTIVNYMVSTYGNNQDKPECYMNVYTVELTAGGVLPILVDGIRSGGLICSGLTTGTLSVIMEDMQPDYRFQYRRKADGGPYTPYFEGTVGPEGNTVFSVSGLTLGVYEFNISNSFGSTPYEFEMLDANSINIIHANPTDGVLCLGQPLELNAGPIGTVISFSWEKDGAVISTEASISIPEVAFSDAGEYILKIVTNEGCTIENAIQVVVNGCSADLEVVKTADSYAKKVGQEIVFTLDVKNYGPAMAVNTVLTDILKSGFSFVSAVASIGNYDETTGLWTIGDLDVDQEAQLTIRALVLETGDTNNVADVESDTQDNELDNNQSAIFITVTNLLVANDDTPASINGKDGGTTVSVLDNDTLNGNVVDPTEVSLTPGVSPHANITMNGDGAITVTPETPAGTYFYPYSICEVLNPTNCSSAEVTIVVDAALLVANDDTPASIN
ncbi:DUF11 domain-containing protein, partial [Sphingobacterium sp. MYb382]|uniref:DUF11 domain-containing protein n=1 Tax=Sphingobacterium sp. MYb382 TaxID=2745278 RepID=UPI0030A7F23D